MTNPYTYQQIQSRDIQQDAMNRIEALANEVLPKVQKMIAGYHAQSRLLAGAVELLAEYGWVPFGTHAGDNPVPQLVFSPQADEAGMPLFERINYAS